MLDKDDSKGFSERIYLFRWLAALAVAFTHFTNRFLLSFHPSGSGASKVLYLSSQFAAGFAHQAVMIFFVLSGYLVGGSVVASQSREGSIDWLSYSAKRAVRLELVVLPAIAVSCLSEVFVRSSVDPRLAHDILGANYSETSLGAIACHAAYLQTIVCTTFKSNPPLWSLSNEFWYYVAFPPIFWASIRPSVLKIILAVLCLLGLVGMTYFQIGAAPIGPYFLIWLIGVMASHEKLSTAIDAVYLYAMTATIMISVRLFFRLQFLELHPTIYFVTDFAIAISFAWLLVSLRSSKVSRSSRLFKFNEGMANFSFSLYATHWPIANALAAALMLGVGTGWRSEPHELRGWLFFALEMLTAGFLCWVFSLFTERFTAKVQAKMIKVLR